MNKAATIAIIVVLVAVAAGFAYGYATSASSLSSANSKISTLNSELAAYQSNAATLKGELRNASSYSVLEAAYSHWDYISIENSSLLENQYAANATLEWIGGPLSGNYSGVQSIVNMWNKFFGTWSAAWYYTPSPPAISSHGSGYTVFSEVQFVLTSFKTPMQVQYLNISYQLDYGNFSGKWLIEYEVWHIVASGLISYSATDVSSLTSGTVLGQAFSHWNDIAIENVSAIAIQYSPRAILNWIGGPLSGTYNYSQIPMVWTKFTDLWSAVWFYAESPPTLTYSGGNYFVNATVQWVLTAFTTPLQVNDIVTNYSLEYSVSGQPMIVYETWHIISASTISYTAESYVSLETHAIESAAFSHWNEIAIENVSLIMPQYANNSTLQWIGGKLAGNYTNLTVIKNTWNKFFSLWSAVWFYSEAPPVVSVSMSNGTVTGGAVTADIQFVVQSSSNNSQFLYINVVYTIHYIYESGSYLITQETFDNVGTGPLAQVTTFS